MPTSRRQVPIAIRSLALAPLLFQTASAGLGPPRDVRSGLLSAAQVTIVKQQSPDSFKIEQTLLGEAPAGGVIRLPGFKLFTYQDSGVDLVEPITASTRILLFLQRSQTNPRDWEVTGTGYCFFWVRDPARIDDLKKIAAGGLQLRSEWEAARDKGSVEHRVEALWPYLWNEDRYFFKDTLDALKKLKPVSGDYAAEQFGGLTALQRKMLFGDFGGLGGEKLHHVVIDYIKNNGTAPGASDPLGARPRAAPGRPPADVGRDPAFEADMNISDGVEGLIGFKDPSDLPYIREVGLSAVRKQYGQTCYSVLSAFQLMPDKANLPVIDAIRRATSRQTALVAPIAVVRALSAQKYPEAIPQLAPYLDDKSVAAEAEKRLAEIVGKDLGPDKQAWLDWFHAHPS
jgi:hypothetical protein